MQIFSSNLKMGVKAFMPTKLCFGLAYQLLEVFFLKKIGIFVKNFRIVFWLRKLNFKEGLV